MLINKKRISKINEKLQILSPTFLNIIDDSEKHIGHEGSKTGLGHFTIEIQLKKNMYTSRISSHKAIYQALGDMMITDIHALSIKIKN